MRSLRRAGGPGFVVLALALLGLLAQPEAPAARANVACDLGAPGVGALGGAVEAITGGAIGLGNPVGDACNAVSGAVSGAVKNPLNSALKGIGSDIFDQVTTWVSEGASWLIAKVAEGIGRSTTPKLTAEGFLAEYGQMAEIAVLLAAAMLLLAVLEGAAQGNAALLLRVVLVNLPLAFIATSVAYAVVQLLIVGTDGLCHAISAASQEDSRHFFKQAITGLGEAGGDIGRETGHNPASEATGTVAVPLFVTFLAAIIGAFAAFLVWLELLMRDAAVYVVALFMPMALAASIWPRWTGALRRSGELLVTVIGSKFVIVSIIALAAGLAARTEGRVEPILAASALMLLACFAPLILLKLVPFAEGAMSAAYSRRGAGGGMVSGIQIASDVQILRNMARSNWGGGGDGVTLWDAGEGGGGASGGGPAGSAPSGGGGSGSGSGAAGGGGGGASGGAGAGAAGAAAAVPAAALGGAKAVGRRAQSSATPRQAGEQASGGAAPDAAGAQSGGESAPGGAEGDGRAAEKPPRPAPESPGLKPERGGGG